MANNSTFLESSSESSSGPDFERVIYGVISVTIVSLLSLGGAVIGPLLKADTKHRWLHFFLAMAVSTLSSDAILHIIPQVMGVHDHGHSHEGHGHGHGHHHGEEEEDPVTWLTITPTRRSLLHLSAIVLSIYTLYFVEFFLFYRKTHFHYCSSPTQKSPTTTAVPCHSTSSLSSVSIEKDDVEGEEENNNGGETQKRKRLNAGHELVNLRENDEEGAEICGLKPRALIILFGDGLHNLVDGIAIGASFMVSLKLGFITTIAVVCHELPHEIGDLAVLVDSGMSMCKALILNLLSALTAYVGLFISMALGEDKDVETVLLAVTAGMFLYVAWVDMLAHLKHDSLTVDHWIITAILQISGFSLGFLLIFSLGWFENLLGH